MKLFKTIIRAAVAAPVAVPLIILGYLGVKIWRPLGMLRLVGFWLMGIGVNAQ